MLSKVLSSRVSVLFLVLWFVKFFDFTLFPHVLVYVSDLRLFIVIVFILLLFSLEKKKNIRNNYNKMLNILLTFLFLFAIINCFVCSHFRYQGFFETLIHWSPIFLLFLYIPFRQLRLNIEDWERVLYILFIIMVLINLVMNLFPNFLLFNMTSGNEKFEEDLRVRAYADGILLLGNVFCLNKFLIGTKKIKYGFLYILSLLLIFLTGFRLVDVACVIVLIYMLARFKLLKIKLIIMSCFIGILLVGIAIKMPIVQERIEEMVERSENQSIDNEDYVRVLLVAYYYTEYFKNNIELFFGSGMVQRIVLESSTEMAPDSLYKSEYSKEVSYMSVMYHYYPVDMGLLGLSWEAGIPTVLIILFIVFYLLFKNTDKRFYYISAWMLLLLIISVTNPKIYHHHNMIYLTIILVILDKVINKSNSFKSAAETSSLYHQ